MIQDFLVDFLMGGVASTGATLFTNPLEVLKNRLQIQREISAKATSLISQKGAISTILTMVQNEGLSGLQKGLVPALWSQWISNGFRLSIFNKAISDANGDISFENALLAGALGGMVGSFAGNPFELLQNQQQAQAAQAIAAGVGQKELGMLNGFQEAFAKNGIAGLWRGAMSGMSREAIGSAAQLATFNWAKGWLRKQGVEDPRLVSLMASIAAGPVMSAVVTIPDLITSKMYSQAVDDKGKGLLYKNWLDCFQQTISSEGVLGIFKGFWPNYLKNAPHSVLILVLFDELQRLKNNSKKK